MQDFSSSSWVRMAGSFKFTIEKVEKRRIMEIAVEKNREAL